MAYMEHLTGYIYILYGFYFCRPIYIYIIYISCISYKSLKVGVICHR